MYPHCPIMVRSNITIIIINEHSELSSAKIKTKTDIKIKAIQEKNNKQIDKHTPKLLKWKG